MTRPAARASALPSSVILRLARLAAERGAVDLAAGTPDEPALAGMKSAAARAAVGDHDQYTACAGDPRLRAAVAAMVSADLGLDVDPDTEVTITCGASEALFVGLWAAADPGDEVVLFDPFYESYRPTLQVAGLVPRFVALRGPDWRFDPDELRAACGPRTRAILLNTPHNPTGKVFTPGELAIVAALCCERDLVCVTDEVYARLTYDDARHAAIARLPGMRARTVTIGSLSKMCAATGWRIGHVLAPPGLSAAIRAIHEAIVVAAAAPLQAAAAQALAGGALEAEIAAYRRASEDRRDQLLAGLARHGFVFQRPAGGLYVLASEGPGPPDAGAKVDWLIREVGVAAVPGDVFFADPGRGRLFVRFSFAKSAELLRAAVTRLDARSR